MTPEILAGIAHCLKELDDDTLAILALLMSRECAKRPKFSNKTPPNPPEGELEDCHPNDKGKGAAPKTQ